MLEKNKNKNDQFSDFLRYKGNKMTERERNAFERNLQKDAFAEEASEGLEGIDLLVARKDIKDFRKQLKKRIMRKQRILWYRIAASVAALMIISSIFLIIDKKKPSEHLSYTPVTQQSKDLQAIKDKPKTENEALPVVPVEKKQPDTAGPERKKESSLNTRETENKSGKKLEIKEEKISSESHKLLKGEKAAEPNQVFAAEKDMPPKMAQARKTSETGLEVKPDSSADTLSEILFVGYGARSARYVAEKAGNEYFPPHPVNGIDHFIKYIRDNIRRPDTTSDGQRVAVVLNFKVNAEGKIDSISIIRSPGKNFSDEAIRLIREGPEWKPAEENGKTVGDEVRIRIVFK